MTFSEQLRPRHAVEAMRVALILVAVAAAVTTFFAVVTPTHNAFQQSISYGVPLVLLLLCLAIRMAPAPWDELLAGLPVPVLGVIGIAALDLATSDASAAAQIFLCYPVVYSAWQLRAGAATAVTTLAVAADAIVVLSLEDTGQALTDLSYVGVTLITLSALLVSAGIRQDRLIAQLRAQASHDPLTGLVTRRVLDAALATALAATDSDLARELDAGTALILLDIDHFKSINDTYGHPVGDDMLVHVARLVSASSRAGAVLARLGGDEIALLLPDCSLAVTVRRADQLVEDIRTTPMLLVDSTSVWVTVTAGVAHVPTDAYTVRDLYAAADQGLYVAKQAGRNRVGVPRPRTNPFDGASYREAATNG